jgi:hypothetical protein
MSDPSVTTEYLADFTIRSLVMKDHKGCYCLYKGCNGAVISRSQRKEHKAKDKIACVRASLGLSATQRGRVTDAPRAFPRPSSPMSLNQPFSASSPPQQPYTPDQSTTFPLTFGIRSFESLPKQRSVARPTLPEWKPRSPWTTSENSTRTHSIMISTSSALTASHV